MGNGIARDIHCDVTMSNDIAKNFLICIIMLNYDITVSPVNSFKLDT